MDLDITRQLGLVTRTVTSREHAGKQARVVAASRTYDTDIDDVWDAITSRERIPRWFMPISGELRLGGRYQLQGNAGGQITRCEQPHHLAVTWEFGGEVSWVDVRLTSDPNGGTRLELEHTAHVKPEFWDTYGPGAVGVGWDLSLLGLGLHLTSGMQKPPDELEFARSEQGKGYITGCSDAWGRASVAAGTTPAAAAAAVAATTAFYTGSGQAG